MKNLSKSKTVVSKTEVLADLHLLYDRWDVQNEFIDGEVKIYLQNIDPIIIDDIINSRPVNKAAFILMGMFLLDEKQRVQVLSQCDKNIIDIIKRKSPYDLSEEELNAIKHIV